MSIRGIGLCVAAAALLPAADLATQKPTFTETIAPIVYRNCVTCHRPGEAAPQVRQPFARKMQPHVLRYEVAHSQPGRIVIRPAW